MLLEALQRLRVFTPLARYRYVGFGSTYFADFTAVHRSLGITKMISIEQDIEQRARFQFNRPFRTVKMIFGPSHSILPTLTWTIPSVVWLDYDGPLSSSILADVDWVCSAAPSGSAVIVTVNADPGPIDPKKPDTRIERLRKSIGAENVPNGITTDGHLGGWKLADVTRTVLDSAIRAAARDRAASAKPATYRQLFNFRYRDGARMATVGGLLLGERHRKELPRCSFDDLDYVKTGADPYLISVPFLTNREVRWLDRQLPATATGLKPGILPDKDRKAYAEIYRFFPTFVDAEF